MLIVRTLSSKHDSPENLTFFSKVLLLFLVIFDKNIIRSVVLYISYLHSQSFILVVLKLRFFLVNVR